VIALLAVAAAGGFLFESNFRYPAQSLPLPKCRRAYRATVHASSAPGSRATVSCAGRWYLRLTGLSRFPGDRPLR
jgi:hypothetical protein